jgi:PAS domain S-box-containing protein
LANLKVPNYTRIIRILYVDDDSSIWEISKSMLLALDSDYEIDYACCVDEGLSKLATGRYDVIVSDYMMPQKDGLQFLKELREQKNEIPFILFTGRGREEVAIKAINLGADGYHAKQGSVDTVYAELSHGVKTAVALHRASETIRTSEEKYRQLVESSNDGIFTIDLSAKVDWGNAYGMKLLGYSESDLPVSLLKLIPAKYLLKTMTLFTDGLKGKVVTAPFDLEVYSKSRKLIPVSYRGTLLHDEKGKVTGVLGIIRDYQDKKKVEKSLVESVDRFQDLIETTGEFIWEMDIQGRYTYCSPQMTKIWGLNPEEMIGKTPFDVMPLDDREKASLLFFEAIGDPPKPFSGLQSTAYNENGSLVYVETNGVPFFSDQGRLLGFRGVSRDITERKKAEIALLESQHLLAESGRLGKVGGWQFDIDTLQQTWTDETYRIHEVDHNFKPTVENGIKFYTPDSRVIIEQAVQEAIAHGKSYDVELQIITAKGNIRSVRAIGEANLASRVVYGFFQDITERKNAEEELRKSIGKIQLFNEKLNVVGSLTRHDVRNKLWTVNGYTHLLKEKYAGQADIVEKLGKIQQAIDAIEKIYDFSKSFEKLGVEELKYVDIKDTVDAVGALFQSLTLKVVNDCRGLSVLADTLLSQVFYNLIDNTIKYGKVTTQIHVYFEKTESEELHLIYEDNGVGISEEDKFKLFSQGFSTGNSTGYGLFWCKKIIEFYGWTITEEGKPGTGIKFVVTIPEISEDFRDNYKMIN